MSTKITTHEQVKHIFDSYDYFLFDCDGVLWLGDHILPHVKETLDLLKSLGKRVIFVTNNSTKSRKDYSGKFHKLGIPGIQENEIFGSSYALAVYVDKILQLPKDEKVWVLGESGIEKELHDCGYKTVGGSDPSLDQSGIPPADSDAINNLDPEVGAVVAGLTMLVNYIKLSATLQYLIKDNKSLPFIATNIDSTFPVKGKLMVGAGSIIESVAFASGRQPDAICGKPNQAMMDTIKAANPDLKAKPGRGLMIGDRLNTDMKFGRDGGLDTLLVLTGIETEETLKQLDTASAPTYYATRIGDIYELSTSDK